MSGVSRIRVSVGYFIIVWLSVYSFSYEKDPVLFLGNDGLSFPGPYHKDFSIWSSALNKGSHSCEGSMERVEWDDLDSVEPKTKDIQAALFTNMRSLNLEI